MSNTTQHNTRNWRLIHLLISLNIILVVCLLFYHPLTTPKDAQAQVCVPIPQGINGHYCVIKSVRDSCPTGFTQTHIADLPSAGRSQNWALHVSRDCNQPLGTSDPLSDRPHAQWDAAGCDNAYFVFCCI